MGRKEKGKLTCGNLSNDDTNIPKKIRYANICLRKLGILLEGLIF